MANSCRWCNMQQWDSFAFWWGSVRECQTTWITLKQCWYVVYAHTNMYAFMHSRNIHTQKTHKHVLTCTSLVLLWNQWEKWLKRSCSWWLLLFCYIEGSQLFKIHTLHIASKQQRTPLSLRICASHFSPNVRINYELINITLRSGYS